MENTMLQNLKEKTGKSIDEWIAIVKKNKLEKHKEMIDYLKANHGFTYGFANLVAHKTRESDAGSVENQDDLVIDQYKGKESLRPIYDKIIAELNKFGNDIEIAPKRAYVSLRRKKQFAIIQPSTKTRVDVGINIKGRETTDRLEASGSFNGMVSHRVRLSDVKEVDKDLINWMKEGYDAAG
jgi:predicted transport protein